MTKSGRCRSHRTVIAATLAVAALLGAAAGPVPSFAPDPLWSEALPNRWVTGAVGGTAVDSHDNVWVFHREASIPDGEKAASLHRGGFFVSCTFEIVAGQSGEGILSGS